MQLQLFGRQPNFEVGLIRSEQLCWMDFESLSFVRIPLLMQTSWIVLFETSRKKRTEIRKLVIFLLIATLYIIICLIGFDPIWKKKRNKQNLLWTAFTNTNSIFRMHFSTKCVCNDHDIFPFEIWFPLILRMTFINFCTID